MIYGKIYKCPFYRRNVVKETGFCNKNLIPAKDGQLFAKRGGQGQWLFQ